MRMTRDFRWMLPAMVAALGLAFDSEAQATSPSASTTTTTTTTTTAPQSGRASKATEGKGSLDASDRRFLEKAARDGLAEVRLGELAKERGMRDEVKEFATRIVADHGKANDELRTLAASKGVALPDTLDRNDQREMDKLAKQVGPDFDRAYMKHMVSDHSKDLSAFRKEAKRGKDGDVRNFAASTLPTLQDHLRMARVTYDIARESKRTGDRKTGSTKP